LGNNKFSKERIPHMENKLLQLLTQYGRVLQQRLFPRLEEGMGPLTDKHQQVVRVLGLVNLEAMLPYRGRQVGRPPQDRAAMARAFVAKAVYNLATTKALLDLLAADVKLRRICGWERHSEVPDGATFSRAFGEFARTEFPQRVHEALIARTQKERLIGHISRDATAICARERPAKVAAKAPKSKPPKQRRKRGEPKPVEDMTRIERQVTSMTLSEMLADLPRHCAVGCKTNSHGRKETWRGYKLHLDVADGQIPISAVLTSANLHDSQVGIPLAAMSAERVTSLYDLMDSAYDCKLIRDFSRRLGHVPIIEKLERGTGLVEMDPHQAVRYNERTAVERVNGRLKDEFGGRSVRVRGAMKVMAHLMFGIVALTVDEILRLCT
jgi:hypothetical protein